MRKKSEKTIFDDISHCPECKSDWREDLIPEELRPLYGGHRYFKREIGIFDCKEEIIMKIICPDCKYVFRAQISKIISRTEG